MSKSSQSGAAGRTSAGDVAGPGRVVKALASPVRLYLAQMLRDGPRCVGELALQARLHESTVSQHLAALHAAGLTRREKSAQSVCYELQPLAKRLLDRTEAMVACVTNRPRDRE